MSVTCKTCGSDLAEGSAYSIGLEWEKNFSDWPDSTKNVPTKYGVLEYLDRNDDGFPEDQGNDDRKGWFLYRLLGRYFKKFGTVDSYGECKWDGPFKEVYMKEKVVTVYEYEEDNQC